MTENVLSMEMTEFSILKCKVSGLSFGDRSKDKLK